VFDVVTTSQVEDFEKFWLSTDDTQLNPPLGLGSDVSPSKPNNQIAAGHF
jgi:hypothetical protein